MAEPDEAETDGDESADDESDADDESTIAIDGSDGPWIERRVVVWRRLEPGDARTKGTELAPESQFVEAKVHTIGIAKELHEELERLAKAKRDALGDGGGWTTRYEPAGVLFALGGGVAFGAWMDYLPELVFPFALSSIALGIALGVFTRMRKTAQEKRAADRWESREEREELAERGKELADGWSRFAKDVQAEGFRTDLRVGDLDEADRLVSIDISAIAEPDTWKPGENPAHIRYGAVLPGGRVVERVAELEDETSEKKPAKAAD